MCDQKLANNVAEFLHPIVERVEAALERSLADASVPATLLEAMRYSCLDGGKRIRPALVLLSAEAVAQPESHRADPALAAVAIELVHCYSLVHDDLPAIDNDTLRRGRATTHVQFDEAMAILAGSALLTRAFELLSAGICDPAVAVKLVGELAGAAGPAGMIAGQVADLGLCEVPEGLAGGEYIHRRKTGAMIRAATRMGGICAGADPPQLEALTVFGEEIGLAFQVMDDLLDATMPAKVLGKEAGRDAQLGKQTYPAELGIEATRRLAGEITQRALGSLDMFGSRAAKLRHLAKLLSRRDR